MDMQNKWAVQETSNKPHVDRDNAVLYTAYIGTREKGWRGWMAEHIADNNKVVIVGKVNGPMEFSHEIFGENFFQFDLSVPRLSDYVDLLPVTVSERLLSGIELLDGMEITVEGQLRSYNKIIGGHNRLILTVFAREIFLIGEGTKNPNQIYLNGFICKKPVYRVTPLKRYITDILLAVNRAYGKSDYIPTIAWGRNARFPNT